MISRWVTLLALVIVVAGTAGAAPFVREGVTPGFSGVSEDVGPSWGDVAFTVALPGSKAAGSAPVIIGRHAYVATTDQSGWDAATSGDGGFPDLVDRGIWRIGLDTGVAEKIADVPENPQSFASDGALFYLTTPDDVRAFTLDGALVWAAPFPPMAFPSWWSYCQPPAAVEGVVYAFCDRLAQNPATTSGDPTVPDQPIQVQVVLAALDATTGEALWMRVMDTTDYQGGLAGTAPLLPDGPDASLTSSVTTWLGVSLAVEGDRVLVPGFHVTQSPPEPTAPVPVVQRAFAFDAATGDIAWSVESDENRANRAPTLLESASTPSTNFFWPPFYATLLPDVAYVKQEDEVIALEPTSGRELWTRPLGIDDPEGWTGLGGFAATDEAVYTTARATLYRLDPATGEITLSARLSDPGRTFWTAPLILAGGNVHTLTRGADGYDALALSADDGRQRWAVSLPDIPTSAGLPVTFGLGEGVLVAQSADGSVHVIGTTGASPVVEASFSTAHPGVGETIHVDLSDSAAGALGPPTRFRVDWGDGAVTDWQASPSFEHQFTTAGDVEARFWIATDANQTASTPLTFHVGATPPNVLETAFARDNQDLTFGVLGVALAFGGGAIAVGSRRRRRNRLQRELAAIDAAAEDAAGNPPRLRAAMEERRAHCHGLLLDQKLDEAQFAIVERHIDAMARGSRMHQMRELFDFLPHAMVLALEEMLADGRITAWERRSFQTLLEENDVLTADQKRQVAGLIEAWFAHDARDAP